ncbi:LysR family transcriptional regulator [uncultured Thiodictyon sp.]|uniref:LysR family transcriptional regulator n=1 Tax=uncultured Thiodictyon sp. TaxID=1846217 RepID=UPI0025E3BBC1|nr:LysR family transcriptional regulator [uncultured Thiodictyon sp.]
MAKPPNTVALEHQSPVDDFNDLVYFASVVEHHGFSAAARATGVEKTRLSRRVAALEQRLGARLLQRSTRSIALTEAGQRFYDHCVAAVAGARVAYESIADLRREPAGTVRMSCAQMMAQSYLAPILPGFLAQHPKVDLILDATDREVNLIEERVDLVLRARREIDESPGLVAKPLGSARRILVASPAYLGRIDPPSGPQALAGCDTLGRPPELFEGKVRWELNGPGAQQVVVQIAPRLVANDMRLLLEAAIHGVGIALLPEPVAAAAIRTGQLAQVLPDWTTTMHHIYLLYPSPRGMLPSVRSLIDYLLVHMPASIQALRRPAVTN